jgi:two-component system sensor histidine kinase BaeS
MRTLRGRLILSHILPLLIVIPLVGIGLIYILETQVVLADLSKELEGEAALTAEMAADEPAIWNDVAQAQIFVTRFSTYHQTDVWLLDSDGKLIASNDPDDAELLGQPLESDDLPTVLSGGRSIQRTYSLNLHAEIVEVLVPVSNSNQEVVGIVRMTQELAEVHDRFLHLRRLLIGGLAIELMLGVVIGLALALNLERPIRRVTQAIYGLTSGREWTELQEEGPEELRLLVRAFNSLIERLRVLEEARRRLLANIVHEVGRPIGAMESAIQALLSGATEDPALRHELLEGMNAQVQRLHPLLDNLSELHGQVLGTLELNCQPIVLSEWLPRTISPWREAAHAKGLHWAIHIPDSLPELEIDPDRIAQVLGNLLSNAIKYTPEGTISVEASVIDDAVSIVVSDTGIGITPEEQARIFEPFYRSERSQRFPQGMGLGLTIAHDLVVAHGGRLEVKSQPGQGSRFTIRLPLTETPSA